MIKENEILIQKQINENRIIIQSRVKTTKKCSQILYSFFTGLPNKYDIEDAYYSRIEEENKKLRNLLCDIYKQLPFYESVCVRIIFITLP